MNPTARLGFVRLQIRRMVAERRECEFTTSERALYLALIDEERQLLVRLAET